MSLMCVVTRVVP